jgi:hypothetical protein
MVLTYLAMSVPYLVALAHRALGVLGHGQGVRG